MRATSPSSILLSLTIHVFLVVALFLTTYFVARQAKEQPVIFELVAGPPTAPGELVAPALGNTTKPIKLEVPQVELVPTMPEPEPVVAAPPEPAAPAQPKKKEMVKPKTPEKPKADTSIAKEMKQAQRMSYNDYLKKHPTPKQKAPSKARKAANVPRVDVTGIAGGVKGGSKANTRGGEGGTALAREQHDQMSTYISLLIQELKKAHEPPPGVSDRLETKVTFDITASGAIMNPRISKSSGDKAFDESVLEAFLRMRSIGPTPNRRSDTWTVTFKMRDEA
ncbi:MAG TPA: TonB family protein [Lacunisphaera sp.]|nr:TonB family protein [Lacunisphaera sp.]